MVPKGWTLGTLKDLADTIMGYAFRSEDFVPTGIPLLRMGNLYQNTLDLNRNPVYLPDSFKVDYKRFLVSPGDLVMSMTGTMGKRDYGFTVEIPSNTQCSLLNQRVLKIVPKNNASSGYILNLLRSELILSVLYSFPGGTKQANLSAKQLQELPVLIPPELEQKKIAQILSTWDKAITVTEKLLVNSQQQKKALMQQLLTGKKRLLDENGVSFSGAWKWLRAAELFKTISQKNNSEDEELLAVTQDLGVILRSMLERRVVMPDGSTKGYKLVVPGNFIISLRSFQGGLEYSRYRGLVSPAYTVLTPIKKIVDEFYKQYYKSYDFIGHLAVAVIGIRDGKQISYEDFSFLKLPYPEIEEQQKIAAVLSAADAEISTLEKKLACLRDEKKALMQQLLTGKRRVKVDEAVAV
ncbi:restriction endonuclease subunit S [Escherichia coli]|uniref:restriction endonuclease subunit S n=1 Tax=Escherichia coli TaxID=562 RepID=UPI000DA4AC4D|nr:restriction endonuclease subunit S [Escherichia coli]EHP6064536.1 restriction endonuclease subunit S [Escherichia coli]EIY9654094.1 restriction endonuclease subunit S [Escherichia coli]ELX1734486.1 restriction endonuclease subunit S [Escherichia coli]MBY8707076.1 restriction endonuclease subunit S [Escherichia coli]MBY8712955.1 restriction endonuclease subunit S [Escherichia coli]